MQRFWLDSYPPHVPADIRDLQHASLVDMMQESFQKYAGQPAICCMQHKITYAELDAQSKSLAHALREDLGLSAGSRVAIMLPNIPQYLVAVWGILRAGLVVVNANPMYTVRELRHQLSDSGAEALIVLDNFAHVAEKAIGETPVKHVILTSVGDFLPFPRSLVTNLAVRHVKKMVPAYRLPNARKLKGMINRSVATDWQDAAPGLDDIAFLQYTGGTTGVSKGVMLTHRNLLSSIEQAGSWTEDPESVYRVTVAALPYYHIFGLNSNALLGTRHGAMNLMIPNPRDFAGFIETLKQHRFSYFPGVNTLFRGLLNTPGFGSLDFGALSMTVGGGMAVTRDVAEQWKSVTGCDIVEAYGLTETSPGATGNIPGVAWRGSIGLPISSTWVKVIDEEGKDLPPGGEGELCIKGPQVMKGYWQRPEATAEVMTEDGYFKTGDYARQDEEGYVYILDRKKDMINVSGFNVYPNEIEDVISDHPGILEAAAVGVPDEKSGEAVKLFVVRKDDSVTEDDIRRYCRENLTAYKCPRVIAFRDELPKSNVGKILRRELREE